MKTNTNKRNLSSLHSLNRCLLLIATLSTPLHAMALVDLKDAAFTDTWADAPIAHPFSTLVTRSYNSRSVTSGLFGYGWCMELETKLDLSAKNGVTLHGCGTQFRIAYQLDRSSPPTTQYVSRERPLERLIHHGGSFTRLFADGTKQKFDAAGRLVRIESKEGRTLTVTYDERGWPRELSTDTGLALRLQIDIRQKKITRMTGPEGIDVAYTYENDNLIGAREASGRTTRYHYDDLHNLIRVDDPDGRYRTFAYDKDKDRVVVFHDRAGCLETYAYRLSKTSSSTHTAEAIKTCGKNETARVLYEFQHQTRHDGRNYLAKLRVTKGGTTRETEFHPVHGQPTSIRDGKNEIRFTYDDRGLMKTRETTGVRLSFAYDSRRRLASVTKNSEAPLRFLYRNDGQQPDQIERPGVGRASLLYKDDGSVEKLETPSPQIAQRLLLNLRDTFSILESTNAGQ